MYWVAEPDAIPGRCSFFFLPMARGSTKKLGVVQEVHRSFCRASETSYPFPRRLASRNGVLLSVDDLGYGINLPSAIRNMQARSLIA